MGLFGGFVSACKSIGSKVVETVKKVGNKIKEVTTNVWNKFSGKDKFEEAERLYNEISSRYNERKRRFESEVNMYTEKIERHVNVINESKEKIKYELFTQMAKKMEKIKDISVSNDFSVEEYIATVLSFDRLRSKSELYKIDFNKHKFKTTFQAIFTLGFYTRKQAKETLYAVQGEEKKIDNEIAKMDAEVVKLKVIEQSLANVEEYFTSLISLYQNLLMRLDNSVNFLYVRCMAFAHKLVSAEMSIKKLPIMQRKEIEAIMTASKILKAMTDAHIMSIEDREKVVNYSSDMEKQYSDIKRVCNAA